MMRSPFIDGSPYVFIMCLPAGRSLIRPFPPGVLAARALAAVILPPLLFFAILISSFQCCCCCFIESRTLKAPCLLVSCSRGSALPSLIFYRGGLSRRTPDDTEAIEVQHLQPPYFFLLQGILKSGSPPGVRQIHIKPATAAMLINSRKNTTE
jgi:hypothetical protein